jgi:hypothetical protein
VTDDDVSRRQPDLDPRDSWPPEPPHRSWAPTMTEEERVQRERFANEMRPLVESLDRLRERGLLD